MTQEEKTALQHLDKAKDQIRAAFRILDPAPMNPVAQSILKALDSIDAVARAIKYSGGDI